MLSSYFSFSHRHLEMEGKKTEPENRKNAAEKSKFVILRSLGLGVIFRQNCVDAVCWD